MSTSIRLPLALVLLSGFVTPVFAAPQLATTGSRSKMMKDVKVRQEARALRGSQPKLASVLAEQAADPHIASVLAHSQKNGNYYTISDLHMGLGKAHPNGAFDRQEDFTRPDVWQRTIAHIAKQPGANTLVIGGDMLDILEHVNPEDGLDKVTDAIGQMVRGHAAEWKSLARAVVNDGLRVVYIRGNHDIRMLDASAVAQGGVPLRQHFLDEVMKLAELSPAQQVTFKSRVAFAGHAAPLGKYGELMVFHGEQQDPTNSWRNPANPFSYRKDGTRAIPRTLGDNVVREEWVSAETMDPDGDNNSGSSAMVVAHRILTDPRSRMNAAKLLWNVSAQRVETGAAQKLAERIDDRATLQSWAERTGFDNMMNTSPTGKPETKLSAHTYAKKLELVYKNQPTPIQERMRSPLHTVNVASHLFGKDRISASAAGAEPTMLSDLMKQMPNVRYVQSGHDHFERIRTGTMADRGPVGFFDTGTWTKAGGEDRLNVVVSHTDGNGRIADDIALFRVNPSNGKPEFQPRAFEEQTKVEGWSR